jgi:hypothetical protein
MIGEGEGMPFVRDGEAGHEPLVQRHPQPEERHMDTKPTIGLIGLGRTSSPERADPSTKMAC